MNIIEQMLVEHAAIRRCLKSIKQDSEKSSEAIYDLDEFVVKCHARIEDEIVFPKLKEILSSANRNDLEQTLSRIEADHKLILKMSEQIRLATERGDRET